MPRASATAFMVEAVPIVLQWPIDGEDCLTICQYSFLSIFPAANRSRASQSIVPVPTRRPLYQPFSMGPPDRTIAGMSTVAAAMSSAGVVLSQPVVRTTASSG